MDGRRSPHCGTPDGLDRLVGYAPRVSIKIAAPARTSTLRTCWIGGRAPKLDPFLRFCGSFADRELEVDGCGATILGCLPFAFMRPRACDEAEGRNIGRRQLIRFDKNIFFVGSSAPSGRRTCFLKSAEKKWK